MSTNTEKPECAIEPVARFTSPFCREASRSIYEVNELFLTWLVRSSHLHECERAIQSQLITMSPGSQRIAAECPFLLVDARFEDGPAWRRLIAASDGSQVELHQTEARTSDASRIGLARSTFFAAWYIVHRWPQNAELLLGANEHVIEVLRRIELTRLATLSEACADWIAPRWPDRPDIWQQLLLTAARAAEGTSISMRQRALQLLLGKLLG